MDMLALLDAEISLAKTLGGMQNKAIARVKNGFLNIEISINYSIVAKPSKKTTDFGWADDGRVLLFGFARMIEQ